MSTTAQRRLPVQQLTPSTALIAFISVLEGCEAHLYACPAHILTLGAGYALQGKDLHDKGPLFVGHGLAMATLFKDPALLAALQKKYAPSSTAVVKCSPQLRIALAKGVQKNVLKPPLLQALLAEQVQQHSQDVLKAIKAPLYQHEFDALTALDYNVGGALFKPSTAVKLINKSVRQPDEQHYLAGGAALTWFRKSGGKVSPGLTKRRFAEFFMYNLKALDLKSHQPPSVQFGATLHADTWKVTDRLWREFISGNPKLVAEALRLFKAYYRGYAKPRKDV